MAIPSKEAFENFIEISKWLIPEPISTEIKSFLKPTKEEVYKYVKLLDEKEKEFYAKLENHEVFKWCENQQNFVKAINTLRTGKKKKVKKFDSQAEINEYVVNRIYDSYQSHNSDSYLSNNYFQNLYYVSPIIEIQFEFIKCLYSYFYSDRAAQIYQAKAEINRVIEKTISGLDGLIKYSDFHEFSNAKEIFFTGKVTERFITNIKELNFNFPFDRNDKTLKERVLVYDLNKCIRRKFRTARPNAIFYLLMVEGIENNIEKRSIERMIAKWRNDSSQAKL